MELKHLGRKPHNSYFFGEKTTRLRIMIREETLAKCLFLSQMSGDPLFKVIDDAVDLGYASLSKLTEDRVNMKIKQRISGGSMLNEELQAINAGDVRVAKAEEKVHNINSTIDNFLDSIQ